MKRAIEIRERVLPKGHPDLIDAKDGLETIMLKILFPIFLKSRIL